VAELNSPIEILKLLNKSNCGDCNEATCLAFAAKVFKGQKSLHECPHIARDVLLRYEGEPKDTQPSQEDQEQLLEGLKARLEAVDFASAAKRLDGVFVDDKLTFKVCGKDFSVDSAGNLYSEIHTHSWLALPALNYVVEGQGVDPSGNWVPFRELRGGKDWGRFFEHRCEKPMKRVADTYPDFFADMLHVFGGRQVERQFDSDISLVLFPLPKVPILICYWRPEDGLGSDFHLFFDSTAITNLSIDSIYLLTTGLTIMFEKIALRHN
jgi:hypothetical protein